MITVLLEYIETEEFPTCLLEKYKGVIKTEYEEIPIEADYWDSSGIFNVSITIIPGIASEHIIHGYVSPVEQNRKDKLCAYIQATWEFKLTNEYGI